MISLIICSRQPDIPQSLKDNISETIGVEYELVVIDNSKNKYSIFQAYNEGVRRSRYPYLCFMHEDILYHTKDWGKKIVIYFQNDSVGAIGVVGSHYMPQLPGSHWSSGVSSGNIIHTIDGETTKEFGSFLCDIESCRDAVLLDGMFLCVRQSLFKIIRFDDHLFSGFHCYDSDICLQIILNGYKNRIVFDIDIEHFSLGNRDENWLKSIFRLYHKWKKILPIKTIELTKSEIEVANYNNAIELKQQIRINNFGLFNYFKILIYYLRVNPLNSKASLVLLVKFISKKIYILLKNFKSHV